MFVEIDIAKFPPKKFPLTNSRLNYRCSKAARLCGIFRHQAVTMGSLNFRSPNHIKPPLQIMRLCDASAMLSILRVFFAALCVTAKFPQFDTRPIH
jgi:hypothetical protein